MKLLQLTFFLLTFTTSCQNKTEKMAEDRQELIQLFEEIKTIANSVSCTNSANWSFVAYGAKACGGSMDFIAYANQIDTISFLKKIETYTELQNEYNIKWGLISDCVVITAPKKIVCENGKPVFVNE